MFNYYMPVELHFGRNCIMEKRLNIKNIGSNPLIVTGSSSAITSGALSSVETALSDLKVSYTIYSDIQENPKIESINKGARVFKDNNCDYIIGIGGGSPIDAAKAISIVAANNLQGDEIYQPEKISKAFPIMTIPTTSGTGTEATQYSVITSNKKKAGFGSSLIFPKISFLDPTYTITMPKTVTRDTAIDALSHLLEGLYSTKRCPLVYPLILSGVRIIYLTLEQTLHEPENYEYRKQLMIASLYGGMVIAQSGTTLQHSIGYPLTTEFGLSHGMANGVVMKQIMEINYPTVKNELDLLFSHLNITKNKFYDWLESLGLNTSLNLNDNFINIAAKQIYHSRNMALNPKTVTLREIENLLASI